jgi:hypothetical protein
MTTIRITDEEFDTYEPLDNQFQDGQQLFETYGEELRHVLAQKEENIWTQVDGDDGGIYIVNGYHVANRIGFYITRKPHNLSDRIELCVLTSEQDI